jgi:Uma2 family endonuclease
MFSMTVLTQETITFFDASTGFLPKRPGIVEGRGYQNHPNHVSLSDYWEFYYEHPDHNYEYNNGILEEKPVAKKSDVEMYFWFSTLLQLYLEIHLIAWLSALEMGFKMQQVQKVQVRKPDMAVVLHTNPIPFEDDDRNYRGIFDMCVEMVSDSSKKEIERDTKTKFGEYEAAGVKEYWLLSQDKDILGLYRLNNQGKYKKVKAKNGVLESKVLPGFRVRVDDLFNTPPLSELVDDPVYADFVFPKFQQERHEKEQERQRADSAEQRAEKLAEFLREQGFNPDELL